MARLGRLAGGLLLETQLASQTAWFLVGDTKMPCDWLAAGFEPPRERDVIAQRFIQLQARGTPTLTGSTISIALEGLQAAAAIAERLTVSRNGSVSERLWALILGEDEIDAPSVRTVPCAWLCEMPPAVWDVVREAVLKCS
jgi:hypothetical protein